MSHTNYTQTKAVPGHFYLFHLLKDAMLASASPFFRSRVVSLSSSGHRAGTIDYNDINFENTEYNPHTAYSRSKLANIYFANELDRRYNSRNLRALSVHPGGIITPLGRYLESTKHFEEDPDISKTLKSPAQGAATTVWAAVAKELEDHGGVYLDEVAEAEPAPPGTLFYLGGYDERAFDPAAEKKLWAESLKMLGLSED